MTGRYMQVNVILTENQISKLKHALKNDTGVTLRIDKNTVGDGNHELFLTRSQLNRLTNADGAVDIKFSKTQLRAMGQSGGLLGNILSKAIDWAPKALPAISSLASTFGAPKAVTRGIDMVTPVLNAEVNKQFLKNLMGVSGSGLEISKIQKAIQNNTGATLKIDKNMPGADKYIKFLTPAQLNKILGSKDPVNIKFTNPQLKKLIQEGGFGFLGPLFRSIIPMATRAAVPLAKHVVAPLAVQAASSAIDAGIQKGIYGSGMHMGKKYKLCVNSDELKDVLQIIAALEQSGSLVEGITETVADKIDKQEGGFLPMLLGSLAASLLPTLLGKGGIRAGEGGIRAGEGGIRAGEGAIYGDMYGKNRIGVRPR